MLLAYRRGLLEPYYEHGRQSIAREEMVLDMISSELESDAINHMVLCRNAILAPHLDTKHVRSYVGTMERYLEYAAMKREYDGSQFSSLEQALLSQAEQMIKAFKMLKERGIIDQFQKEVQDLQKQYQTQ